VTALHRLTGIREDYAARIREARAFAIAIDIASEATDGLLKPWLLEAFEQDVALIAPCKEHAFAMVLSEVGPEGAYSESLGRNIVPTDFRKLPLEYVALTVELMNEKEM
jgi:CHASE2 domain-containing sensor protein